MVEIPLLDAYINKYKILADYSLTHYHFSQKFIESRLGKERSHIQTSFVEKVRVSYAVIKPNGSVVNFLI